MIKKLILTALICGVSLVSAKTFNLKLHQASIVSGTELAPGDYKAEVADNKLVIRSRNQTIEAAVTVESGATKFSGTSIRYQNGDGKYRVQEIRVGGTNMKVIVNN
jgi:hypothetical protein